MTLKDFLNENCLSLNVEYYTSQYYFALNDYICDNYSRYSGLTQNEDTLDKFVCSSLGAVFGEKYNITCSSTGWRTKWNEVKDIKHELTEDIISLFERQLAIEILRQS